jgi:hypothetical protein
MFSIYLILLAALGLGVYSACNRNEYQKQKNNVSGEKSASVRRADNLTAICGILNIPQPYRLPRPVTGIALLYFYSFLLEAE